MSQQINLLNPAFRKVFDWLSAVPLAIATCVMLAILGGASAWASMRADDRERAANQRTEALKAAQEKLLAMTKSITDSKPNQQLAAELASARALLRSREEILKVLEGGAFANTLGFAEFLRGFSRQAPKGLWLTSFTIGAGGAEMEIHGRMLDPAALPEYINRLKTEKVFQGRSFASLTIQRPDEAKDRKSASTPTAPAAKPGAPALPQATPPSFVDFVLMPSAPTPASPTAAKAPDLAPNLTDLALIPSATNLAKSAIAPAASPAQASEKKP